MDDDARRRFERRVRELEGFGHRGSGTASEAQAADYLLGELEAGGFEARKQPFTGSRRMGARLFVHVAVAALGAGLLWSVPQASMVLGALALASLMLGQTTRMALLGRFLINAPSSNVVASVRPADAADVRRRIVVLGHYDTQRTGIMWREGLISHIAPLLARAPGLVKSPLFPIVLAMVTQLVLGLLALLWPELRVIHWGGIAILSVYAVAGFLLGEWAVGSPVPGANDNATGTAAVLALAEAWREDPIAGVEVVVLLTGCEETGLLGAAAWAESHRDQMHAVPTTFLNLDSLGYGRPRFIGREHSLAGVPASYPREVVALCGEVAVDCGLEDAGPKTLPVATDGLAFLVRGVPGASIVCFDDHGHMPNYHLPTDTSDNLDFDVAWEGVRFGWAVLRRMARPD